MRKETDLYAAEPIDTLIATVRGQKVILDSDLARVYGVPTKRLNEQVRRNSDRFPSDFVFQLTLEEAANFKSQIATSSLQPVAVEHDNGIRSQIATGSILSRSRSQIATLNRGQNIKYLPYAFTEHGAIMAANVLNSPQAVQMSVFIVRAFVKMREQLISRVELEKRLLQVENVLLGHDDQIRDIYEKIRPLLLPPSDQIGFQVHEKRGTYSTNRRIRSK